MAPVIPVLTITDLATAVPLARALAAGGLCVLEITLRTPVALAAIEAMRKAVPDAIVGVGTLTRAVDFAAADRAGAQFGVTPGLTPELAAASRGKLFPAQQAGGVAMLQALGAPFPDVSFCPTGGITRATAADYLALPNVVCVGGSWVAPKAMLAAGDWAGIEALARDAASLRKTASPPGGGPGGPDRRTP